MAEFKIAMVSSTVRDLREHRREVKEACLRQSVFPKMMEHLPATDADAITESLKMVDQADIYLGIFAHRYGPVAEGHDISITEMEYNRAVERGIPRLIFIMHQDHPMTADQVETGEGSVKLEALRERLLCERVVNFFKSPADLRAHLIDSLSHLRDRDLTAFHYVSEIPAAPQPYIAHPFTLLQTRDLIGRGEELNLLTDWVGTRDSDVFQARVLTIVAIGGMGKSALTWKWFRDIAPEEMKPLAGRMWWSFYESDARFESFVIRALAYVTGRAKEDIQKSVSPPERQEQLLAVLDREPFLLVLDGLERVLIAYTRMDAARLADDDLDERAASVVVGAPGVSRVAAGDFDGQHRLRKTADPRAGAFLRKLARVQQARILVTTRLYPAELEMVTGDPVPRSFAYYLTGLSDDDAVDLWRAFGVSGSPDELLRLFHTFDNHPLLIQSLASEVAHYRRAPGDFDGWQEGNPEFDPFSVPLVNVRAHVLAYALKGLDEKSREVLHTVAALRMPASYDTLEALLVGEDKLIADERGLDGALTELEERGLLGWDKRANRYDQHPVVRGVVWRGLDGDARRGIFGGLQAHFESLPPIEFDEVSSLDDLTSAVELYSTLIGLGRWDEAVVLFYRRLGTIMQYRLGAARQQAQLLEMLFPDGSHELPRLSRPDMQGFALNGLAHGYHFSGQPGQATPLYRRYVSISEDRNDNREVVTGLGNLAGVLRLSGALRQSEAAARKALLITREQGERFDEAVILDRLGLVLAARGEQREADAALRRALGMMTAQGDTQAEGVVNSSLAQAALWSGDPKAARLLADRAWEWAHGRRLEGDFIRAARLQGEAALGVSDLEVGEDRLHQALLRAREVDFAEVELPALIGLAQLRRLRGDPDAARELLDDVWEVAERGPYPLFDADGRSVLAQIERDAGNDEAAIEAATEAYRLAWCDGPPFAYHWGLETARAHLAALNAEEPNLPPYDESRYEPTVEVDTNPPDEFGGGEE